MAFEEHIPRVYLSREQMLKRVARFKDLKGFDGGLPDSYMPDSLRILYNVIGFQPPPGEQGALTSPVGAKAARMSSIKISEGFNLGYCEALPGKGPMMHNHDTNETFICMSGRWRASWEDQQGSVEAVDLEPLDVISFPAGMLRRFENVSEGPADQYSVLMFVIAGDAPAAEFSKQTMDEIENSGVLDQHPVDANTDGWLAPRSSTASERAA